MKPWGTEPAGRFDEHSFVSDVLRGNPLGDPHERPLWVYLPPGYDEEPDRRFPSIYVIQGLTGQLDMWRNRVRLPPELPRARRRAVRRLARRRPASRLGGLLDSLGGSQFLDSPGTGRYHTYLCDEVVPWSMRATAP